MTVALPVHLDAHAAVPGAPTTPAPDIRVIPLEQIHESPLNTRKHFDPVKLEELAASMKSSQQLTPVLVRPSTLKGKPGFELASGHRRRRAAPIAGMKSLLAIVRDLDDKTFLEILTVDNLQREDVHPLEEAQGYRNLLTIDGYDIKRIAERVSKSETYIYDRMKLLQLIPALQELFFANRFSLGHAILLARLSADDQERAMEPPANRYAEGFGGGGLWQPDYGHPTLGLPDPQHEKGPYAALQPRSVRQLQAWIDDHVRFDAQDESVPQLFPETATTIAAAAEAAEKVISITHDYQLRPEAKDADERTYGPTSWKRADGLPERDHTHDSKAKPSKTCEYSVVGVVAAGPDRGQAFRVCIDKKRCMTHWGDEIRERNKRERARAQAPASRASTRPEAQRETSWDRKEETRKQQTAIAKKRWEKGGDAVLRAIVPHVKKIAVGGNSAATEYFLGVIEDGLYGIRDEGKVAAKLGLPRGSTPAELVRHLIMVALLDRAKPGFYDATNEKDLQEDLDKLKIKVNVVKLLDAANPAPKPEPKKAVAKPAAKKPAVKKAPAKKAPAKAKRVPRKPDFMQPKQPDAVLAAVVGDKAMPRTEITMKLWSYIKKNGLQDAKERRMINADEKLKPVFGGKAKVSVFAMTKLVNKHIKSA